jgi:uncharacterized Zn finger protein (UPF0148 family)
MTDLCKNCGHALPNAAGPGLYCPNCGEPIGSLIEKSKREPKRDKTDEAIEARERLRRRMEGKD